MQPRAIFIGWDPREAAAFAVCRNSIRRHLTMPIPIHGLVLDDLRARGLYTRPMEMRPSAADKPVMWDVVSDAPQSTEHANSRFFINLLAESGWALFMDGDILVRDNLTRMFDGLDPQYAVYCVKHKFDPPPGVKMDGQTQARYQRKNWSSFMALNVGHESNKALTPEFLNTTPGRDLHRFCWLQDDEIGELDPSYNFLVGHTDPAIDPKVVHFTEGVPDMVGYHDVPFADEWRAELNRWAA